jgi:hypothetical protein
MTAFFFFDEHISWFLHFYIGGTKIEVLDIAGWYGMGRKWEGMGIPPSVLMTCGVLYHFMGNTLRSTITSSTDKIPVSQ